MERPVVQSPDITDAEIDRFSPLYTRYNGFLLGEFLSLSFAEYGRAQYPVRRARMMEFLSEIAVDVAPPENPTDLEGDAHAELLIAITTKVAAKSTDLAEFVLIGALLTHYGMLADADPDTAQQSLEQVERIRAKYDLPAIDPDRFRMRDTGRGVDDILSPSLAYLGEIVDTLEPERDTAFVIMPFSQPYASYFSIFYRPSLEQAGFRAFRAWGGLSNEDYCDLLLKLIAKSGMVWADVSELNYNVLYEIGAAHAFGKLSMLVVREDLATSIPANIGHDAIVKYSTTDNEWPESTTRLMAALIAALQLAAERGKRLRVGTQGVQGALDWAARALRAMVTSPEADEALQLARDRYAEQDHAAAERHFDDAIRLGHDDSLTILGRGTSRVSLGKYAEAEADFDQVLARAEEGSAGDDQRRMAHYFRGMSREQQENYAGARDDYMRAIEFGFPEVDALQRRAFSSIRDGDLLAARADVERVTELDADAPETHSLTGDLLTAEGRYTEAIAEYDIALEGTPSVDVELSRALALLLSGHVPDAVHAYEAAADHAPDDALKAALDDLRRSAAGHEGFEECASVVGGAIHSGPRE